MVVGVTGIRLIQRRAELRIRQDKVFRKAIVAKHSAVDADRDRRQIGIDSADLAVIQLRERIRQRYVVAVGEAVAYRTAGGSPKVLSSGLRHSVEYRSDGSKARPSDIDAFGHLIQQCRLTAAARRVECFLQSVEQEIRRVEFGIAVKLPA